MQLRRSILLAIMIVLIIYFEIHSCSEDSITIPDDNGKNGPVPGLICEANDIFFIDEQTGWAVGAHGTGMYTRDGGTTWTGFVLDDIRLTDINFRDPDNGWIVGKNAMIFSSDDSGVTWNRRIFSGYPVDDDLYQVVFFNEQLGYIQGYHGVFRTDDGGMMWENNWLPIVTYRGTWDMSIVDEGTAFLLGSRWTESDPILLYKTDDGGITWVGIEGSRSSVMKAMLTICFMDEMTGWAGGGIIKKTTDGGETWEIQIDQASVREFCFLDDERGFAVGGGTILRTTDGGICWEDVTPDDARVVDLRSVSFITNLKGWIIGRSNDEITGTKTIKHSIVLMTDDGGESWTFKDFPFDYTEYMPLMD